MVNALDMAFRCRTLGSGGIVHADHGVQFTSWVFTQKIRDAGLLLSIGAVGDGLDNAMMESAWSSMQADLLDRQSWTSKVQLDSTMFEWIEGWYNLEWWHSSRRMACPSHFEQLDNNLMVVACWKH